MTPRNDDTEDSEMLSNRGAPLISKPQHNDTFIKVALSAMVALLAFLLGFAYNGNREIGVLAESYRQNADATDRRINALEQATDRRITALENRVERIWEGSR